MNFESFKNAPWFGNNFKPVIGGLGNIGSWTALLLARLGYELYLYDMDIVEPRNVGSQLYSFDDVGLKKNYALSKRIKDITNNHAIHSFEKYDEGALVADIMISCFDNMKARKIMFERWLNHQLTKVKQEGEVNIFIDGRSLAETGTVFAVKSKSDAERYKKELFEDSEVEDQVCSFKSTGHNGAMIGSLITSVLVNHIANKVTGQKLRDVPFRIDYQLPIMAFST